MSPILENWLLIYVDKRKNDLCDRFLLARSQDKCHFSVDFSHIFLAGNEGSESSVSFPLIFHTFFGQEMRGAKQVLFLR